MIVTKNFEIKKNIELTSDYIEKELFALGVEPLRWAIVDEDKSFWIVSVSYCC